MQTAFAVTGLVFAIPAALLPYITVEKFNNLRTGDFLAGVNSLGSHDMPLLATWVFICGGLAPVVLLGSLVIGLRHPAPARQLYRVLSPWAMPEVYVLGVFVALTRLGSIVDAGLNAGFWSYAAMACALLIARHAHRIQEPMTA
jgi:paraquat-inducible protein A